MLRLGLIGGALPLGLLTGLVAWLAAGGASASLDKLAPAEEKVRAVRAPREARARAPVTQGAALASTPLFLLTTGPGAVREPSLRVDGVSVTPRRTAVLVSIDGKPAEWLRVGESREGLTVRAVDGAGATFETLIGEKVVSVGELSAASAPAEAALAQTIVDQMPPGVRGPLPPASAPGMRE